MSLRRRHALVRVVPGVRPLWAALLFTAASSVAAQNAPPGDMLPPSGGVSPSVAFSSLPEKPFAELSRSALSLRDSIVTLARAQIGTRYVLGGESPRRGFDCSGLVQYVLAALRISVPRTAAQQATRGTPLPKDATRLRPGDLLTFGKGSKVTHVGIYVGDGRYVHASTTAGRVIETSLSRTRSPLIKAWRGGRDVLAELGADQ